MNTISSLERTNKLQVLQLNQKKLSKPIENLVMVVEHYFGVPLAVCRLTKEALSLVFCTQMGPDTSN